MKYYQYITILIFIATSYAGMAQSGEKHSGLYLFADRGSCISGDTLWFKVNHKNGKEQVSNVVHVQLTNAADGLISSVRKKSTGGWAEGYIPVPDSLSSGVYFLSAFFNGQRTAGNVYFQKRTLFVYNRFEKVLSEFAVPAGENKNVSREAVPEVTISSEKSSFAPREKVTASIDLGSLNSAGVNRAVVSAQYLDEFADEAGSCYYFQLAKPKTEIPYFEESDGVLLSGKAVSPVSGKVGRNVVVLISLINDPQYFDYCVTDAYGQFHFFIKDAYGTGEVVLQAVSESGEEWILLPESIKIESKEPVLLGKRPVTYEHQQFWEKIIDAAYYDKLFSEEYTVKPPVFKMVPRFKIPFYGNPHQRVVLSDFVELADFQDVSRELLHGVQYRRNGEDISIRLLNLDINEYFKNQPFRLINGIPVFRNSLLAPMGSNDIDYVDYVLDDRVFGDLRFSGVLAIYLKDRSNAWMNGQPNFFRFTVPFLQPDAFPSYMDAPEKNGNIPDMRRVLYWQLHDSKGSFQVDFRLSDLKGKVRISVEGVTGSGAVFNASQIIEVK